MTDSRMQENHTLASVRALMHECGSYHPCVIPADWLSENEKGEITVISPPPPNIYGITTLNQLLKEIIPGIRKSLEIMFQACSALEWLQELGLGDCIDPVPANIFIGPDDRIMLSPFDSLSPFTGTAHLDNEAIRRIAGTRSLEHTAPECFTFSPRPVSASLVYRAGIIMYQVANRGKPPYGALPRQNESDGEYARYFNDFRALHSGKKMKAAPLNHPAYGIIQKCLNIDPRDRYHDISGIIQQIQSLYRDLFGQVLDLPSPDIDQFLSMIALLHASARHAEVIALVRDTAASTLPPGPAACYYALSLIAVSRNDEALSGIEGTMKGYAHCGAETHYCAALVYSSTGNHDSAFRHIKKADSLEPDNSHIIKAAAALYLAAEKPEQALSLFLRADQINPGESSILSGTGIAHFMLNNLGEALTHLSRACAQHATPESLLYLGKTSDALGLTDQALSCYRQALQLAHHDCTTHYHLALALMHKGEYGEALSQLTLAGEAMEANPDFCFNMAECHVKTGSLEQALLFYEKVLSLNPDHSQALYKSGRIYESMGNYSEAAERFARCSALEPGDTYSINKLGECFLKTGLVEKAVTCFRKSYEISPGTPYTLVNLGIASMYCGMAEEAKKFLNHALLIKPGYQRALIYNGIAHYLTGDCDAALHAFTLLPPAEDVTSASPWFSMAALCRWKTGNLSEAKRLMPAGETVTIDLPSLLPGEMVRQIRDDIRTLNTLVHNTAALAIGTADPLVFNAPAPPYRLTPPSFIAISIARNEARFNAARYLLSEHLLIGIITVCDLSDTPGLLGLPPESLRMISDEAGHVRQIFNGFGINMRLLKEHLGNSSGKTGRPLSISEVYESDNYGKIFDKANNGADDRGITINRLLMAIFDDPSPAIRNAISMFEKNARISAGTFSRSRMVPDSEKASYATARMIHYEKTLTRLITDQLYRKFGPAWEQKVCNDFPDAAKNRDKENEKKKHRGVCYSIIDILSLGQKHQLIVHNRYWNIFSPIFTGNGKNSKEILVYHFKGIYDLRNTEPGHTRAMDDTTFDLGIGGIAYVEDCIIKYLNSFSSPLDTRD